MWFGREGYGWVKYGSVWYGWVGYGWVVRDMVGYGMVGEESVGMGLRRTSCRPTLQPRASPNLQARASSTTLAQPTTSTATPALRASSTTNSSSGRDEVHTGVCYNKFLFRAGSGTHGRLLQQIPLLGGMNAHWRRWLLSWGPAAATLFWRTCRGGVDGARAVSGCPRWLAFTPT